MTTAPRIARIPVMTLEELAKEQTAQRPETEFVNRLVEAAWAELQRQVDAGGLNYIDRGCDVIDGQVGMPALIRAVLTAAREPTEAMTHVGSGLDVDTICDERISPNAALGVWQDMIETALAEPNALTDLQRLGQEFDEAVDTREVRE